MYIAFIVVNSVSVLSKVISIVGIIYMCKISNKELIPEHDYKLLLVTCNKYTNQIGFICFFLNIWLYVNGCACRSYFTNFTYEPTLEKLGYDIKGSGYTLNSNLLNIQNE